MECNEFRHWLRTRDIRNNPSPGALAHRLGCIHCQRLYVLDTKAEQGVCQAFASQEMPRKLVGRIDRCLDSL